MSKKTTPATFTGSSDEFAWSSFAAAAVTAGHADPASYADRLFAQYTDRCVASRAQEQADEDVRLEDPGA